MIKRFNAIIRSRDRNFTIIIEFILLKLNKRNYIKLSKK